jgi:UDP-galactopyranose mutase
MKKFDLIIIGAGLFGSIIAKEATNIGKKVLVVDKRDHVGGNCYTKQINGINVHMYGPHIFHTNNRDVWNYINLFCEFNNFTYRPKVVSGDNLYSFPINLNTFKEIWGITSPEKARIFLEEMRCKIPEPKNLEEYALNEIGEELYYAFIHGYTVKQWGKDPKDLPTSIIKRIPVRIDFNDNQFSDRWQGIPVGGYTEIFYKMLNRSAIEFNCDFIEDKNKLEQLGEKIIYTGKIDEYYDYCYGKLEYRSLRFEQEEVIGDFQGVAAVNYADIDIPYTRIVEHKHFEFLECPSSIITREYPCNDEEAFYPINDEINNSLYQLYKNIPNDKVIFGGRLGSYQYLNMDETIRLALELVKNLF